MTLNNRSNERSLNHEFNLLALDHLAGANTSDTPENSNDHHVVYVDITEATMDKQTYDPSTLVKVIHFRKNDIFCQTAIAQVGCANSKFNINAEEMLIRGSIVDGAIYIVV